MAILFNKKIFISEKVIHPWGKNKAYVDDGRRNHSWEHQKRLKLEKMNLMNYRLIKYEF